MKLEISLLGDFYAVGLLHLDKYMIKAGMHAYGSKGWTQVLTALATRPGFEELQRKVREKTGKTISRVYGNSGVCLGGPHFGLEVFLDGKHQTFGHVAEKTQRIPLSKVTKKLRKKDILGVCRSTGIGSVTFCWDDVDGFDENKVLLEIHELSQVLNERGVFNLIFNVSYEGRAPDRQRRDGSEVLAPLNHVFHMMT